MPKLIIDYTIVSVSGSTMHKAAAIASAVKRLLKDGWTPLGSITADHDGTLYQVMIKYAPPDTAIPPGHDRQTGM